jgi:hypothetical protein
LGAIAVEFAPWEKAGEIEAKLVNAAIATVNPFRIPSMGQVSSSLPHQTFKFYQPPEILQPSIKRSNLIEIYRSYSPTDPEIEVRHQFIFWESNPGVGLFGLN